MVAGGEAGERCGARFAAATRGLGQGERTGEDEHVEGPAAQLGIALRGSSGEAGRCAAGGVAACGLCSSGLEAVALCGQAKRRAAR